MLLRPRQTVFIERTLAALRDHGNTLAVAPTGFGKTITLAAIVGRLLAGGGRALVLQHRQELVAQNVAKFEIINPAIPVSIVDATGKDFAGRAVFAMVPTLARPQTLAKLPPVDLVVIDEAHHAAAETYRRIIDQAKTLNPEAMVLGLTATPRRSDKLELREVFNGVADQVLLGEVIQSGHLVRPKTFVIDLGVQKDLLAVKRRAADFAPDEVDAIMNHRPINEAVVRHWLDKARDRQTVGFTSTVAHAVGLAEAFQAEGVRAAVVHGAMSDAERRDVLADYDAGRIQILSNCFVLGEGWDHPPTSCVLLLRPTSFKSTWIQMIGRGLRPLDPQFHPGQVKTDCMVLDFGISTILHGTLEQQVDLDAKLVALGDHADGNGSLAERCPSCGAEVPPSAVECPLCGEALIDDLARLLNFELVEIDLFDRSNFAWTDTSAEQDGGRMVATGFESFAVVLRRREHWATIGGLLPQEGKRSAKIIAAGDRAVCLARADDFLNENESAETAQRSRAWTKQLPSDKQLAYLPATVRGADLTRYAASCHLAARFNRRLIKSALLGPVEEVAA